MIARLLSLLCLIALVGCGYPEHIDPPLFTYQNDLIASLSAAARAKDIGGIVYHVADTHSMEPLLRGDDYIVVALKDRAPYVGLKAGQPIAYKADWYPATPVVHRLTTKDKGGWILGGDNNRYSEPQWRVTEATYIGTVDGIYRVKP